MDRKPEHLTADPFLRQEYIGQQSFDEFCDEKELIFFHDDWESELLQRGAPDPQGLRQYFYKQWIGTLDSMTNMSELMYLSGMTNVDERNLAAAIDITEIEAALNKVEGE